jgi:hypothetical protein
MSRKFEFAGWRDYGHGPVAVFEVDPYQFYLMDELGSHAMTYTAQTFDRATLEAYIANSKRDGFEVPEAERVLAMWPGEVAS